MNSPEIEMVLEGISKGSKKAFRSLVEIFQSEIHQFICYFMGSERETEDVTQEVFIEVFRSIKSYRGNSSLKTWIFALAKNVCCRWWREKKRERNLLEDFGPDNSDWNSIPDYSTNLEIDFEKKENREAIDLEMNKLPEIYKIVIFFNVWEEMSYAEIAQVLDIPLGTVKSRIHNGLAILAGKLKTSLEAKEKRNGLS